MKTKGTVNLKLFTDTHETTHDFHVTGDSFQLQYDGILGRDFWESKKAVISYCNREFLMEDVVIKFDPKDSGERDNILKVTLKARSENYVKLPTACKGQGLISRKEIIPGIYMAESHTREIGGASITSIVNTLEEDVTIDEPLVELEDIDEPIQSEAMIFATTLVEDKLTFTTVAEHAIPTPTVDPTRGINSKNYRIPEIHKEEVNRQTEQKLRDGIIAPSTSPWNLPILVVPKKADASGVKKWRTVVDFRKLNDVTIGDSFLIPVISEVLDALGDSRYFSTIDCASGFHQILIKAED
jgi:hypothetical protein